MSFAWIWNSVATGMLPAKHGIPSFTFQQADGTKRLYSSKDRKVQTLWGIVSEAGMRVGVVNFWNTFPPEKVEGVIVSDHLLARELEGFANMLDAEPLKSSGSVIYPPEWNARWASPAFERPGSRVGCSMGRDQGSSPPGYT